LWNAARFVLMNLEGPRAESPAIERSEDDRWIMSRLNRCISEVNATLEAYRFDEAANTLYQFIWHEYCDQYIERAKLALADKNSHQAASTRRTLLESFDTLLRLLHPFMPFITEEIWQAIPHTGASIMLASYPTPQTILIDESIEKRHLWLQTVIANVASTTSANRITPSQGFSIVISSPNIDVVNFLRPYDGKIKALTRASEIQIGPDVPVPSTASANTVYIVNGQANVFVWPHSGAIDIAKEISRKEKRRSELNAQMEQDQKKLSNPDFVAKVPPDVLKKTTARHEECRAEHEKLSGELQRLREMAGGSA
ncbi:MAG: class I tRNA ligase family protein, partial [Nitrospirota bacterium]